MSLRSLARWTLPPLALLALGGWISSSNPAAPAPAADDARSTAALEEGAVARPANAFAQAAETVERPATAAAVAAFVARKNTESAQDTKAFAAAGWQLVDVPAPDAQLVGFDPALLLGREDELRQQIASTTGGAEDAPNLARIAREAHDEATGIAAVEGLGRLGGEEAQTALEGLLHAAREISLCRAGMPAATRTSARARSMSVRIPARLRSSTPPVAPPVPT